MLVRGGMGIWSRRRRRPVRKLPACCARLYFSGSAASRHESRRGIRALVIVGTEHLLQLKYELQRIGIFYVVVDPIRVLAARQDAFIA